MRPLEVESESLRLAARQLTGVIDDTDTTLQRFQSEIDALGQPWGDDDLGMIIGTIYQAALAMVMNAFNSNLEAVDGYGERLGVAADNYDETDAMAAQGLDLIRQSGENQAL